MRTSTIALIALQAASAFAWNSTCKPGVGPCVGPEVVALESSECQDYHIFLARGSDSGYPGHQGPYVKLICDGLGDSCGYENIIYPANASVAGPEMWCKSAHIGATHGQEQMSDYAERCPESKLILSGYSQGGSVALDILGGGGGAGFDCEEQEYNPPLSRTEVPGKNIVAAIVFGAVVRTKGQNYTVETSKYVDFNGQNPRDFNGKSTRSDESLSHLDEYSNILRDYCNIGDPVCAKDSEPADVARHLNYFEVYAEEAAAWVIQKASGKKVAVPKASSSSSAPTSTKTNEGQSKANGPAASGTSSHAEEQDDNPAPTTAASKATAVSASWGLSVAGVAVIFGALFQLA